MLFFANELPVKTDEEVLLFWRERDQLRDADIDPLRDEIERRGLLKEAEEIERSPTQSFDDSSSRRPETYLNLSILFWCLRELWLRFMTRNGMTLSGTVKTARRFEVLSKTAGRSEIHYSYTYQGKEHSGRVVRDFMISTSATKSLVSNHPPGTKLEVRVLPSDPGISYFPSGFGFVLSILGGGSLLLVWMMVALLMAANLFVFLAAVVSKWR